jgi:HEPN domain-containing protein
MPVRMWTCWRWRRIRAPRISWPRPFWELAWSTTSSPSAGAAGWSASGATIPGGGPSAAEKALKALLLALDQEPERTHSIERLLSALELLGLETTPLRQLPLKALQRMTSASRYPDGEEAPVDLFDERDGTLALAVARAVVGFADQQLGERDAAQPP